MGQDVRYGHLRPPAALIQPVAVFGETGQIHDTEVGTAGRQRNVADDLAPGFHHLAVGLFLLLRMEVGEHRRVHIEGRGLSQIVVTGPYKLAGALGNHVLILPLIVRLGGPAGGIQVVGTHLEGRIHVPALSLLLLYREAVVPAGRDAGRSLGAQHRLSGMGIHKRLIQMGFVIEAIHVDGARIVLCGGPGIVVSGRREPGRILPVAKVREHLRNPPAAAVSLFSAFVADTPENHGRMVAVSVNEGRQVFLRPLLKELGITVGLFGVGPGVREFVHHQEAHPVAEVQEFRCRRVVAGADGVAAHLPEHLKAAHPGVLVPDCSQGARIVMQANALQEGLFSVQVKAVGLELNLTDAERCLINICGAVLSRNAGAGVVQDRGGRAPELGRRNAEFLD